MPSTRCILYPIHDQHAFKTLDTQCEYAALYFTGSHQYWQTRTVDGIETQKLRYCIGWCEFPTADQKMHPKSSRPWEPAGDFQWSICFHHVKQQLCVSLKGKGETFPAIFLSIQASSLLQFTSSPGRGNNSWTFRQDLVNGITNVEKPDLFPTRYSCIYTEWLRLNFLPGLVFNSTSVADVINWKTYINQESA